MLWLTDPMLAVEYATYQCAVLLCKVGVWLVWPVTTWIMSPPLRRNR